MFKKPVSSTKAKEAARPIPDLIYTPEGVLYRRGNYLGKGGFARCYELIKDRNVYAGKAVAKAALMKPSNKEKMSMEISIHKSLNHPHIVKMFCFFEDSEYIYMVLELCSNRSMMEMQKRRGFVTEPEARYFMKQIVVAVEYLHNRLIIHRDLKLGNIFINQQMQLKVGDFGLATQLSHRDERKDTLCGTPNYIAPEMLQRKKHSFEVDIWALGCILYTLICGRPPFETNSLQETYNRIKQNAYNFPSVVGVHCSEVTSQLLHPDPTKRPKVSDILTYKFFIHGYTPRELPSSCLSVAPKINQSLLGGGICDSRHLNAALRDRSDLVINKLHIQQNAGGDNMVNDERSMIVQERHDDEMRPRNMAVMLDEQLTNLLNSLVTSVENNGPSVDILGDSSDPEAESPSLTPSYYVTKWVDYSDKYGLGYQLSDTSVGVIFNDSTRITLDRDMKTITYAERHGSERYYPYDNSPDFLKKKIMLLKYFMDYMKSQLILASNDNHSKGSELARVPVLSNWFRSRNSIVIALTNGTIQINFFEGHLKLILCPMVQAVSVINEERVLHTYSFETLVANGCSKILFERLKYSKNMIERLICRLSGSQPASGAAVIASSKS